MNRRLILSILIFMAVLLLGCKADLDKVFPELEEYEWGPLLSRHLREIGVEEIERVRLKEGADYRLQIITIITPERRLTVYIGGTEIPKVKGGDIEWEVLTIAEFPKVFYDAYQSEEEIYDYKTGKVIEKKEKRNGK